MTTEARLEELAREWNVSVTERFETASSLVAYGQRGTQPVVLKVVRHDGDEWRSGEILDALQGAGVVRVYEHTGGAVLLERITPGDTLVGLVMSGRDDEATDMLADVIGGMSRQPAPSWVPTVHEWSKSFERYVASGDDRIAPSLVAHAHRLYTELCASQTNPRLLHGDLQHYNVLRDNTRGWLAIDPKGVIGEVEYEIGAALRNPHARPELLADAPTVEARARRFATRLGLDTGRVLAWAFSQAVLSAIWSCEDGFELDPRDPALLLAVTIRPMLSAITRWPRSVAPP